MTTPMVAQLMNRDRYTGKLFLLGMASGRIFVAENWSEISFTTVSTRKRTSGGFKNLSSFISVAMSALAARADLI